MWRAHPHVPLQTIPIKPGVGQQPRDRSTHPWATIKARPPEPEPQGGIARDKSEAGSCYLCWLARGEGRGRLAYLVVLHLGVVAEGRAHGDVKQRGAVRWMHHCLALAARARRLGDDALGGEGVACTSQPPPPHPTVGRLHQARIKRGRLVLEIRRLVPPVTYSKQQLATW